MVDDTIGILASFDVSAEDCGLFDLSATRTEPRDHFSANSIILVGIVGNVHTCKVHTSQRIFTSR